jgi:hypothetical protein
MNKQLNIHVEYVRDILAIIGMLCVTFVIIPWLGMIIIGFLKAWWDENNRFDG